MKVWHHSVGKPFAAIRPFVELREISLLVDSIRTRQTGCTSKVQNGNTEPIQFGLRQSNELVTVEHEELFQSVLLLPGISMFLPPTHRVK